MTGDIVQAYSVFEKKVVETIKEELKKNKLSEKLEDILVPTHQVTEVKKGKRTKKEKKFFPGYVLVKIDLTKETYSYRNLTLSCSACGNLTIQTDPDKIYFIPSIYLGYKYKKTKNFHTNISLGIQLVSPGQLENFTDTEYPLPSFVQSKVDEWMTKTQNLVDTYGEIQPSINLGFGYVF